MKKFITPILLLSVTLSAMSPIKDTQAASKFTLSKSKITLSTGASTTVTANKSVKWKSSNSKVAKVKKLSAKKAKISANKVGTCKITATWGNKKKTIHVTIRKSPKPKTTAVPSPDPQNTETPTYQPTIAPATPINEETIKTQNPVSTTTPDSAKPLEKISTKLVSANNQTVTFSITNETGYDALFGRDFSLEKLENGKWVPVKPNTPIDFPLVALLLEDGKSFTDSVYLSAFAPLENGTYRIVKVISVAIPNEYEGSKTPSVTTYTEFSLNDSTEKQPVPTSSAAMPTMAPVVSTMEPVVSTIQPVSTAPVATDKPKATPPVVTPAPQATTTPVIYSNNGVSATIEGYNDGKLSYVLTNNLEHGDDIQWKDNITIQKEVNGEWVYVEQTRFKNEIPATHKLCYGESHICTENIAELFDLEPGNYCMVRVFYAVNCKCCAELKLPFEVR